MAVQLDDYFSLPGTSGVYLSTPDRPAIRVVGDLEVEADIEPDDWSPSSSYALVSTWTGAGSSRGFSFLLSSGVQGRPAFVFYDSGGTSRSFGAANADGPTTGRHVLKAQLTHDVATSTVTYFVDGVQLGTPVTIATTGAGQASSVQLEVGTQFNGTSNRFTGKVYSATLTDGIGGTVVASLRPEDVGV